MPNLTRAAALLESFARYAALATLLVAPLAFDASGRASGLDATLPLKHAALQVPAFAALAALLLAAAISGRLALRLAACDLFLAAFLALGVVSTHWATNREAVAKYSLLLAAAAGVGLAVRHAAAGPFWRRPVALLLGGAVLAGALDSAYTLFGGRATFLHGSEKFGSLLFPHDNVAALLFAPLAGLAGVLAWRARSRGERAASAAAALVLLAVLAVLGSKASFLALLGAPLLLGALVFVWRRLARIAERSRATALGVALVGAVLLCGLVLLPSRPGPAAVLKDAFNRGVDAAGINYGAAYMRPRIWRDTFELFREQPLLGCGLGNFYYVFPRYETDMPLRSHAHNQLLQILAELGLFGLAAFALFLLAALAPMLRVLAARESGEPEQRDRRTLALASGIALVVLLVQSVFETPLLYPFDALALFALAGLATAAAPPRMWSPDLARVPVVRFALLPAAAVCVLLQWIPASLAPVTQAEYVRAAEQAIGEGDEAAARSAYAAAESVGVEDDTIHARLGLLEVQKGRLEPALDRFRRAAALFPNSWFLHLQQAFCLIELRRTDAALQALDRAQELYPAERSVQFWRGKALVRGGRQDEGIEVLERHRETVPEAPELLRTLGDAYYDRALRARSLADAASALALYQRCVEIGYSQPGGWISQRIAQLGNWLVRQEIDVPASAPEPGRGE